MPITKISVPNHLPTDKVRALADAVQDALVTICDIPPKDRFQFISRLAPDAMIIDPTFPDLSRTADASMVEIIMIGGRDAEQKSRLYQHIVSRSEAAGFVGDDIMIALIENEREDWSAGRGQSYANVS
ncbi:MAG: tautomerase family protein [Pseudomonadota bacterium]